MDSFIRIGEGDNMSKIAVEKEALDKFKLIQTFLRVCNNEEKNNTELLLEALEVYAEKKGIAYIFKSN